MIDVRNRTGRKLAIGFQWSFNESILQLKQDILNGVYGKIKQFKTIVYFPRDLDYYHRGSGWAGKRRLNSGEWLLDSVASNATAHYLHNMLFLTGAQMDRSSEPALMDGEVYRANPIEMFDTCALRIVTADDTELLFYATHAVPEEQVQDPLFVIEGEKGKVTLQYENGQEIMTGCLIDGQIIHYKPPGPRHIGKLYCMGDAIREDAFLPCVPETVLPHLKCICCLGESFPETPEFAGEYICYSEDAHQYTCKGLEQALMKCWQEEKLPYEKQIPWAQKPHKIIF